jgi:hypothetical protein
MADVLAPMAADLTLLGYLASACPNGGQWTHLSPVRFQSWPPGAMGEVEHNLTPADTEVRYGCPSCEGYNHTAPPVPGSSDRTEGE